MQITGIRTDLAARLDLRGPLIQAPMAGGATTPELVAAVSNAGALGSLGGAYLNPAELETALRQIKTLTQRPFKCDPCGLTIKAKIRRIKEGARAARGKG